jgi:hypothetical protein
MALKDANADGVRGGAGQLTEQDFTGAVDHLDAVPDLETQNSRGVSSFCGWELEIRVSGVFSGNEETVHGLCGYQHKYDDVIVFVLVTT